MTAFARGFIAAPTRERRRVAASVMACACLAGVGIVLAHNTEQTADREGPAPPRAGPEAGEIRAAAHVARAFVEDYLDYLHGRRTTCTGASVALQARLRDAPPHPSRVARRRRVRLVELHAQLSSSDSGHAVARVLDADTAFTIAVELRRGASAWKVTDVG